MNKPDDVNWQAVYFAAQAEDIPFQDVTLVTTGSEFFLAAHEAAAHLVYQENKVLTEEVVNATALALIADGKIFTREYVRVKDGHTTVCMFRESVDDDDAKWQAVNMIAQATDVIGLSDGVVYFGYDIRYQIDSPALAYLMN